MQSDEVPDPARYGWLKRSICCGAGVLVILMAIRCWWEFDAQRRMNAIVADARSRGEPVLPEEFNPTRAAPEAENAATAFVQAASLLSRASNTPAESSDDFTTIDPAPLPARTLARAARQRREVDWGVRFHHPIPAGTPLLNGQMDNLKRLAAALANSASQEFSRAHEVETIEILRDIRAEARAVQSRADLLRVFDLSAKIDFIGLRQALSIGMGVGSPADQQVETVMRAFLNDLLDESDFNSGRIRAIEGDRMLSLDLLPRRVEGWPPGPFGPARPVMEWMLHPLFVRKFMEHIACYTAYGRALSAANLPACRAILSTIPVAEYDAQSPLEQTARLVYASGTASLRLDGYGDRFRYLADRRATALVVAIRLYALHHENRLPAALSELVPEYLAALPADPMRADGDSFGYRPRANPPILYSVGFDQQDGGGTFQAGAVGTDFSFRWSQPDAVYTLVQPGRSAPATSSPAPTH